MYKFAGMLINRMGSVQFNHRHNYLKIIIFIFVKSAAIIADSDKDSDNIKTKISKLSYRNELIKKISREMLFRLLHGFLTQFLYHAIYVPG